MTIDRIPEDRTPEDFEREYTSIPFSEVLNQIGERRESPDHCRHGNCPCRCIAAARETFEKGYDARKLGTLFERIIELRDTARTGKQKIGVVTVEFSSTDVNAVTAAASRVVDAFEDLKMEK
ncbi:hypothetical protein M0R72_07995 [Candidatus Pacearchaeota archaeon]|jgi:hypothetical protein|nr:hypothetical protein [Candidatus Pacearchaeota archaeon]